MSVHHEVSVQPHGWRRPNRRTAHGQTGLHNVYANHIVRTSKWEVADQRQGSRDGVAVSVDGLTVLQVLHRELTNAPLTALEKTWVAGGSSIWCCLEVTMRGRRECRTSQGRGSDADLRQTAREPGTFGSYSLVCDRACAT